MNKTPFKPAWWLPNGHFQTIWPALCRREIKNLPLKRERFELSDGDFIDLDYVGEGSGPLIFILHGLEGSVHSPYAKGMLRAIYQQGWRGAFMHFRSCSGEMNRLPQSYHSGATSDVGFIINTIRDREPNTHLAAIGFSMGGNILLKWLGETAEKNPLNAAIAISVPFELHKTSQRITYGFSRIYQWHLLKHLRRKMHHKIQQQKMPFPIPPLNQLHSIRDFDDKITAPLHGFSSAEEYYTRSSSRQFLNKIHVPTLLLQAEDDPFMVEDLLPKPHELSPYVTLELTKTGGHVGFIGGNLPWRPEYWLEERVPLFLQEHI